MSIIKEPFGHLEDGRDVELFILSNENEMDVSITNYGGIITSINVPDRNGVPENVVLCYASLEDYIHCDVYFGALIGRYGNRIADGRFKLDGKQYQLTKNDGKNHLHGGYKGFHKVLWDVTEMDNDRLVLHYRSPDGEEGYPGNLDTSVVYTLTDQNQLIIQFEAVADKPTPVNLTAHSYFNLTGKPTETILGHDLRIPANAYTPVNSQLIPTGDIKSVTGTPFDFTQFRPIGSRLDKVAGGYDHNYVLNDTSDNLRIAAELYDSGSGRKLDVLSTEPGIQFYSGNFLDGSRISPSGIPYEKHTGLCLEPQHFPNSPNEPKFESTILRPGEIRNSQIVYAFSVDRSKEYPYSGTNHP